MINNEPEHNCRDHHRTQSNIEKYGLSVVLIEATEYLPAFAYSIGLWQKFNHPEVIAFGLSTETLHGIINDVAELVKVGKAVKVGENYDFFENSDTQFVEVDHRNLVDYFGSAIDFYGTDNFKALELIWTDRDNRFPWDTHYEEEFKYRQPLLDRNADFKFREEKNVAVFTTRQFLELNKPILHVVHDIDGDWQFLTGDQLLEDAKVVALEQMTLRDKTLNDVFNLDYGEYAKRESLGGSWIRGEAEDNCE